MSGGDPELATEIETITLWFPHERGDPKGVQAGAFARKWFPHERG